MRPVAELLRSAIMLTVAAMAVLLVVSCGGGNDDVEPDTLQPTPVQPQTDMPILFSASEQDEQDVTRTETPLEDKGIHSFKVYGFKIMASGEVQTVFPGYTVNWVQNSANTTISNTNDWEYVNQQSLGQEEQTIKYWDWSADTYRFFGVAGARSTNTISGTYKSNPQRYELTYKSDATNPAATPYYSHLWVGNSDQYGQPVQLEFIQPLSKVRFMFIFENPDQASTTELTAKSFCPTNGSSIKERGNVTISYPLTGDASETFAATAEAEGLTEFKLDYYETTETDGTDKVIKPYLGADASKTGQEYSVLPVTGQGSYTLTVRVNGEPKTTVVPAEFMEWKPGCQYTYIFKVHVDLGVEISSVQSAFTTWKFYDTDHTVYNW